MPAVPYDLALKVDLAGDVGTAIATFAADRQGTYTVTSTAGRQQGVIAVGDNVSLDVLPQVLGAVALLFISLGVGVVIGDRHAGAPVEAHDLTDEAPHAEAGMRRPIAYGHDRCRARPEGSGLWRKSHAGRRVRLVFICSVTVLAAHILADAFVAPVPGTSQATSSRHLVPLALLGLGVWLFPRLAHGAGRPPWRSPRPLTLVGGLVALQSAADGLAATIGPRAGCPPASPSSGWRSGCCGWRGDATGVACSAPAARRGGVLGAYVVVLPISMAIVATQPSGGGPAGGRRSGLGRPARAVTVRTADGLTLHGWYVSSQNGAAVHRLSRASGRTAGAPAREARLRRPSARYARLRRERGRPERLRLGLRARTWRPASRSSTIGRT